MARSERRNCAKWVLTTCVIILSNSLGHGVQSELLPLVQLPDVKAVRARLLFDAGTVPSACILT